MSSRSCAISIVNGTGARNSWDKSSLRTKSGENARVYAGLPEAGKVPMYLLGKLHLLERMM
jgi:hypothetical protein